LNNLSQGEISIIKIIYTGLLLSIGIATMRFIGMSAMSMKAYMSHDVFLYGLAIITSWGLATLTIALKTNKFKLHIANKNKHLTLSTLIFGFSVASMHYLAMSSTYFFPDDSIQTSGFANEILVYILLAFTVVLMVLLILFLFYQEKISGLLQLASSYHQRVIETIDNMQDGFILSDDNNKVLLINKKFQQFFREKNHITTPINGDLYTLYQQLATIYFKFDNVTELQKMLDVVTSKSNLLEPLKVMDKERRWWLLRQNRTSANIIIQTWTNVTKHISQANELTIAKNTAIETLENLRDTQEELLEVKKMASLGGLVSGVAHELNTPLGISITSLSSIMEIIEQIQSSVTSGSIKKSELVHGLKTIGEFEKLADKNLSRMARVIQQFKYTYVDQEIEISKKFFLANTLSDLLTVWNTPLNDKNLTLCIDIENDINLISFEIALTQVLGCLISNSIEHAFDLCDKGSIEISARQEGSRLLILYSDNGCGIDKNIAMRVFEPFVTTKRNKGGVGLGLHIAYNLVNHKLKGKIKLINPSAYYNTIFSINIPMDCSQIQTHV
jgi:signal transduction histidine kinase